MAFPVAVEAALSLMKDCWGSWEVTVSWIGDCGIAILEIWDSTWDGETWLEDWLWLGGVFKEEFGTMMGKTVEKESVEMESVVVMGKSLG